MIQTHTLLPKRRSIRLKEYDYSQEGLYFVTLCTKNKVHLFGHVESSEMILNDFGQIAYDEWLRTDKLRENVELGEFVVMPNHLHAIVIITERVGAYCIRQNKDDVVQDGVCNTPLRSPSKTIGAIVRGYKSAVTKRINNQQTAQKLSAIWQRNFYDHIIRDHQSCNLITDYIINNPANWQNDKYYEKNVG